MRGNSSPTNKYETNSSFRAVLDGSKYAGIIYIYFSFELCKFERDREIQLRILYVPHVMHSHTIAQLEQLSLVELIESLSF